MEGNLFFTFIFRTIVGARFYSWKTETARDLGIWLASPIASEQLCQDLTLSLSGCRISLSLTATLRGGRGSRVGGVWAGLQGAGRPTANKEYSDHSGWGACWPRGTGAWLGAVEEVSTLLGKLERVSAKVSSWFAGQTAWVPASSSAPALVHHFSLHS